MDLVELQSAEIGGNLWSVGVTTNYMDTGEFVGLGSVVDQLWGKGFGSPTRAVSVADVEVDIEGGFLGAELKNIFGSNPYVYQRVVEAFIEKAKRGGALCR